jgi:hypothetical protein
MMRCRNIRHLRAITIVELDPKQRHRPKRFFKELVIGEVAFWRLFLQRERPLLAQGRSHGPPPVGPLSGVNPSRQQRARHGRALEPTSSFYLASLHSRLERIRIACDAAFRTWPSTSKDSCDSAGRMSGPEKFSASSQAHCRCRGSSST